MAPLGIALAAGWVLGACYRYPQLYLLVWVIFIPLLAVARAGAAWMGCLCGTLFFVACQVNTSAWVAEFVHTLNPDTPLSGW